MKDLKDAEDFPVYNKEIFTRVLKNAINNGYAPKEVFEENPEFDIIDSTFMDIFVQFKKDGRVNQRYYSTNDIIFDHEFAKALWPDNEESVITMAHHFDKDGKNVKHAAWKWHIQEMVVSKDPIRYLGDYAL